MSYFKFEKEIISTSYQVILIISLHGALKIDGTSEILINFNQFWSWDKHFSDSCSF